MKTSVVEQVKRSDISLVVDTLLKSDLKRVTKFVSPKLTIKATRLFKPNRVQTAETYIVSIGRPNFAERKFIKDAVKAGEPFPVRNILFQHFPESK